MTGDFTGLDWANVAACLTLEPADDATRLSALLEAAEEGALAGLAQRRGRADDTGA